MTLKSKKWLTSVKNEKFKPAHPARNQSKTGIDEDPRLSMNLRVRKTSAIVMRSSGLDCNTFSINDMILEQISLEFSSVGYFPRRCFMKTPSSSFKAEGKINETKEHNLQKTFLTIQVELLFINVFLNCFCDFHVFFVRIIFEFETSRIKMKWMISCQKAIHDTNKREHVCCLCFTNRFPTKLFND